MHITATRSAALLVAAFLLMSGAGCNPPAPPSPQAPAATGQDDEHGQAHGHSHSHGHEDAGPHGGHLVVLGDEKYHVEWLHDDDSGLVTIYLLDAAAENTVAISADSVTIETQVGDDSERHELAAVNRQDGATAQFELRHAPLVEVLKVAGQEGVAATITLDVDGQTYTGTFEHHAHAH